MTRLLLGRSAFPWPGRPQETSTKSSMPAAAVRRGLAFASGDRKRYDTSAIRPIFENLPIARLALEMLKPIRISCSDHEGARWACATVGWHGLECHLRLVHGQRIRDPTPDRRRFRKNAADKKIQPCDCSKES